jgi:hypothetical protein
VRGEERKAEHDEVDGSDVDFEQREYEDYEGYEREHEGSLPARSLTKMGGMTSDDRDGCFGKIAGLMLLLLGAVAFTLAALLH